MGVDYYNCEICDSIFHDAGHYGYCGNCEANLCGPCFDKMGEKNGVLGEGHENADDFGEDAPRCCDNCDGTLIDEGDFVGFLVSKLGKTREELETEFRTLKDSPMNHLKKGDKLRRISDGKLFTYHSPDDSGDENYIHVEEMAVPVYLPDFEREESE